MKFIKNIPGSYGRRRVDSRRSAQSISESVILVGLVTILFVFMGPLFKRGIQAVVKLTADQLSNQINAEQKVTATSGYLIDAYTTTRSTIDHKKTDIVGDSIYNYNDRDSVRANSTANLGFTNRYD